jgi:hypothetical protein
VGIAGLLAAMAVASAAPSGGGVIDACAKQSSGILRLTGPGGACHHSETPVSWNVQGPPGEPGSPAATVLGGGTPDAVPNDATTYMALYAPRDSATESEVTQVVPVAGTLSDLYADTEVDPGCNASFHLSATCNTSFWTLTVMRNGAATGLSCEIRGQYVAEPHIACTNIMDSVSFAAGDIVSIRIEPNPLAVNIGDPGPPNPSAIHWTAGFTST